MVQLTLRESNVAFDMQAATTRLLRTYHVSGLPAGHVAIIRQLPAGGWRLMIGKPGKTLEIRGEFLTAELALARAQLDYDTIVW